MKIEERAARLAEALVRRGVDLAFGIPGSGPVLDFLDAFQRAGGTFVCNHHEGAAPIMAGTLAKRRGKPVIALCANGTARFNLAAGLLHCWFERLPVIAMWDEYAPDTPSFQRLQRLPEHDFSRVFRHMVPGLSSEVDAVADELVNRSLAPEPGPVGISLALPPAEAVAGASTAAKSAVASPAALPAGPFQRPVLIFGAASADLGCRDAWRDAFAAFPAPRLTTIGAKGLFPEKDGDWGFRVFTGVGGANTPERRILEEADLVVGLDLRDTDVIKVTKFAKTAVLLDSSGADHTVGFGGVTRHVKSPAEAREIVASLTQPAWDASRCREMLKGALDAVVEKNPAGELIERISRDAYGRVTVVVDDGIYQKHSEYLWLTAHLDQFVATGVGRNMGSALPAAIAVALAEPGSRVVCLTGDGGLPMYLGELGLDRPADAGKILILHFADQALGSMKVTMRMKKLEDRGLYELPRSYRPVLGAYGFETGLTSDVGQASQRVQDWLERPHDLYLEHRVDPDLYVSSFFRIR